MKFEEGRMKKKKSKAKTKLRCDLHPSEFRRPPFPVGELVILDTGKVQL
jgi:hypothetical protein